MNSFWWPLDLTPREEAVVHSFRARMDASPPPLDALLLASTSQLLCALMSRHVGRILDRDGLPHLCHIVNGWGNGVYQRHRLAERISSFIQRGEDGLPFILQRDPEGEYHPWQSFAYAVMAGIDPDEALGPAAPTLRELAKTSRTLNTSDGHELGHLLFALAHLDPDPEGNRFRMTHRLMSPRELLDTAVHAHHFGSFEVCRKFHLTEGIAAMAALVPEMAGQRATAQGFLGGQLDILFVLGAMLTEVRAACEAGNAYQPDSVLAAFRHSLIMGDFFENHAYYAGHLIELAAFAAIQGYAVTPAQRAAMAFVVNEINSTIIHVAGSLSFPDCFLHFGHYRRAITLLAELEEVGWRGNAIGREHLGRYAVDFDAPRLDAETVNSPDDSLAAVVDLGLYQFEQPAENPRPRFLEVVAAYEQMAPADLSPRGGFNHFRRIGPARWPRALHYELLDYGDRVGVEIHLESDAVLPMAPIVHGLLPAISRLLRTAEVQWDPSWWKSRGRLRAVYSDGMPSSEIACGLLTMIEESFAALDLAAMALSVSALAGAGMPASTATSLLIG